MRCAVVQAAQLETRSNVRSQAKHQVRHIDGRRQHGFTELCGCAHGDMREAVHGVVHGGMGAVVLLVVLVLVR